jgi:hypothetical protein
MQRMKIMQRRRQEFLATIACSDGHSSGGGGTMAGGEDGTIVGDGGGIMGVKVMVLWLVVMKMVLGMTLITFLFFDWIIRNLFADDTFFWTCCSFCCA